MAINRAEWPQYQGRLTEFYKCLTKVPYQSRLVATKQAYALETIRPGRIYSVYTCPHCGYYHVGRRSQRNPE